jgi:hypothetical protein
MDRLPILQEIEASRKPKALFINWDTSEALKESKVKLQVKETLVSNILQFPRVLYVINNANLCDGVVQYSCLNSGR